MLKQINCNIFFEKTISFHEGLNVVLGDSTSTNSIGKSTLLMIIDFAFGGDSYITKNSGSIKELGHHDINFSFLFNAEELFFSRSTDTPEDVFTCDSNFVRDKKLSDGEYTSLLKTKYALQMPYLSFRSAVSLYSRIWGKENNNVDKPLQAYLKEIDSDSVYNLVKLFNKYASIAETRLKVKETSESKKVLDGVFKKNYIRKLSKTDFKVNQVKIEEFSTELKTIKDNLLQFTLSTEALSNKDILSLQVEKNKLLDAQSILKNKIKRIELNLEKSSTIKSKHLSILSKYFKEPNIEKIEKIEDFHNKIKTILREELHKSKKVLEKKAAVIDEELSKLELKISQLLKGVESPSYIVEKIYDLTVDTNKLKQENKFHEEKETVVTTLVETKTKLEDLIKSILDEIELAINNCLTSINVEIHGENKKSPKISLKEGKYTYNHFYNTGTGKSFVDLIIFDLSIFQLTLLPIIIHDSFLFKNIEDFSVDKIIKKYSEYKKQIFISIDGITKYHQDSQKLLQDLRCIELSNTKLLFTKDWR